MARGHAKTDSTPAPAATGPTTEQPKEPSLVDVVFDTFTGWAAHGLEVAKRGLETSARWLDARAKRVGEVATKIAPAPRAVADEKTAS